MSQDEEERQVAQARRLHEIGVDDADCIQCRRCGATGLYWQTVTQQDGFGEKSVLFDAATKRRHVCDVSAGVDAFGTGPL